MNFALAGSKNVHCFVRFTAAVRAGRPAEMRRMATWTPATPESSFAVPAMRISFTRRAEAAALGAAAFGAPAFGAPAFGAPAFGAPALGAATGVFAVVLLFAAF